MKLLHTIIYFYRVGVTYHDSDTGDLTQCSILWVQVEKALEVYQSMRQSNVIGSPECYTAAVHACSQKGDLDYALTVYDDMKKDGVKPDQVP